MSDLINWYQMVLSESNFNINSIQVQRENEAQHSLKLSYLKGEMIKTRELQQSQKVNSSTNITWTK